MSKDEVFDPKTAFSKINDKLDSPDKFAEILSNTLEKSKVAEKAVRDVILDVLKRDKDFNQELEKIINEYDRKEYRKFWKATSGKIFFGIWSVSLIVVTHLVKYF